LKKVKYLGFYQPHVFGKYGGTISHYAKIESIEIKKRIELFPKNTRHPKANGDYYKIYVNDINVLKNPLKCKRNRANYFINTTLEKLLNAEQFNDIFNESPLEDVLWEGMKQNSIAAERQFFIRSYNNIYCLDFATFCEKGNLNIECDGDAYHISKEKAVKDNQRDNYLTKKGWSILRYSTTQLQDTDDCISEIKESIYRKGGIAG
jgi:very-short-patch-repair endonuclease